MYAFTSNKSFLNLFLSQRNEKLFKLKTVKMDKDEFKEFDKAHNENRLAEDNLEDSDGNDIKIIATIKEGCGLTESCDYILSSSNN